VCVRACVQLCVCVRARARVFLRVCVYTVCINITGILTRVLYRVSGGSVCVCVSLHGVYVCVRTSVFR